MGRRYRKKTKLDKLNMREGISSDVLQARVDHLDRKIRMHGVIMRILFGLATASAVAIIVAIVFLPILKIYGTSMTPTLYQNDIVLSIKGAEFKQGDIISFYYNNNILVKRVIAVAGDWVDIDDDGNVSVNGVRLKEDYVDSLAKGNCDIELPYQVHDGTIFVMGDHRSTSKDSRSTDVGCISYDKIVGKIVYRVWPFNHFGAVQ